MAASSQAETAPAGEGPASPGRREATAQRPERPVLEGRVRRRPDGAGLLGVELVFVPREPLGENDASSPARATTAADGSFRLRLRAPLAGRIEAMPLEGYVVRPVSIDRAPQGDLVLWAEPWPPAPVGAIRGVLRSERGEWGEADAGLPSRVSIDLVSEAEPRVILRATARAETLESGEPVFRFAFEDVPALNYELTVSSLDHYRWHPRSRFVRPPQADIEFLRMDGDRTVNLAFRVTDAATGEVLEDATILQLEVVASEANGVLLHSGPLALEDFPLDAGLRWAVVQPGYATAFGDERAFASGDDGWTADVRLERGWSKRVVTIGRDPFMRPLAGIEILAGGVSQGRTDRDGVLTLTLPEAPSSLEVRGDGWSLAKDPMAQVRAAGRTPRAQVIVLTLTR